MTNNDPKENWINHYYNKITGEYQLSFNRRNSLYNWSLTALIALAGIYATFYSEGLEIPNIWRFVLVTAFALIELRFFMMSMVSHGFLRRWRYLQNIIEAYWFKDTIQNENDVNVEIKKFDHGTKIPMKWSRMIAAEFQSGFALMLLGPFVLIGYEIVRINYQLNTGHVIVISILIVYIIWEIVIFVSYRHLRYAEPRKTSSI